MQHPFKGFVFSRNQYNLRVTLTVMIMKKANFRILFSIAIIFLSLNAYSQEKETRDVPSFSAISLGIAGDLYFTQGSPREVIVQADENSLDKVVTEVKDGVLKVKKEKGTRNLKNVTIWVTAPDLEGIYLAGSGSIIAEGPVSSDELELKVSGSGNIKLMDLKAEEVDLAVSGSGLVTAAGNAEELGIALSGSGNVNTLELSVDECSIKISGSGNCKVNVTEELDARISGSGNVAYSGNPQVDAIVTGSGKVRSIN